MCTTHSAPVVIRAIPTYRPGEANRCPGCGHSNWLVGRSTARGERPLDRPYSPSNVLSTAERALGIDPARTFVNGSGRPMFILDEREPVRELI